MEKKIVHKVEEGMDPQNILCTTYQMRNFYTQFKDGFFSNLDVMNLIQHYKAAKMSKSGMNIVDVCCGRSLMLPLLRYHAKNINSYTGVDISEANIREAKRGANKDLSNVNLDEYYPFKVDWILANVAEMGDYIKEEFADFVIYTSAIEHMHRDMGLQSLKECYKIMKPGSKMFLSCPNTEGNGYNTQYAAHVYEWGYNELKTTLNSLGFEIIQEVGLVMSAKDLTSLISELPKDVQNFYNVLKSYLPSEFLTSIMGIPYPTKSKEILFVVEKPLKDKLF